MVNDNPGASFNRNMPDGYTYRPLAAIDAFVGDIVLINPKNVSVERDDMISPWLDPELDNAVFRYCKKTGDTENHSSFTVTDVTGEHQRGIPADEVALTSGEPLPEEAQLITAFEVEHNRSVMVRIEGKDSRHNMGNHPTIQVTNPETGETFTTTL